MPAARDSGPEAEREAIRSALLDLFAIKDSDIRITTLEQGYAAVDHGIHMGGAFSAVIPMVALFYGGFMNLDIEDPARPGQDIFVLSKGHAVATLASICADLGYFPSDVLSNSRSAGSALKGHPGPTLAGVHVATGPLGQGLAVAQGFAMAGRSDPRFTVFCLTGDGELQQGIVWEAFMHAPVRGLDNLCVLVDKNEGQLDDSSKLLFPMANLPAQIESFGWRVLIADGTSYDSVLDALEQYAAAPHDGRPTAIVCNTTKGHGAFSSTLNRHKITLHEEVCRQELSLQRDRRSARVDELMRRLRGAEAGSNAAADAGIPRAVVAAAARMNLELDPATGTVRPVPPVLRSGTVAPRDKAIIYDASKLPRYPAGERVAAMEVITAAMRVFAGDPRVVSVDADLSSTSGLQAGVGFVDQRRAINVGIAESNMMCIGEAYAALGYNAWVSTFCPFFDWKVLRRIAVGSQEREESMADPDGWLSEGHGLDLTFLATAANLDTQVNGATHMGNDDVIVFGAIAGLKIIDVSCPNQLVSIMRWIMAGNRGLVYLRIMRAPSGVLHEPDVPFEYGRAVRVHGDSDAAVNLVSSGRGVHEIVAAAAILEKGGVPVAVYDMASFDPQTMRSLVESNAVTVIAEQNNGMLWNMLARTLLQDGGSAEPTRVVPLNLSRPDGGYRYIHSATYAELISRYGLSGRQIAEKAQSYLEERE